MLYNINFQRLHLKHLLLFTGALLCNPVFSQTVDLNRVEIFHDPEGEHCIQEEMMAISDPQQRFLEAFECGDELFATHFNAIDGVGANVGIHRAKLRLAGADEGDQGENEK